MCDHDFQPKYTEPNKKRIQKDNNGVNKICFYKYKGMSVSIIVGNLLPEQIACSYDWSMKKVL